MLVLDVFCQSWECWGSSGWGWFAAGILVKGQQPLPYSFAAFYPFTTLICHDQPEGLFSHQVPSTKLFLILQQCFFSSHPTKLAHPKFDRFEFMKAWTYDIWAGQEKKIPREACNHQNGLFFENFDDESEAVHIAWQVYMRGRFLVRHTCISRISLD